MHKRILPYIFILLSISLVFAEEDEPGNSVLGSQLPLLNADTLLAISEKDYPATPGDVYRLTYQSANIPVSQDVLVDSHYTINLGVFGKINAKGLEFTEIKGKIESLVISAYPGSMAFVTIVSNGYFQVFVKGEVVQSSYVSAWGMERLSAAIKSLLTPYSSIRNIEVVSSDGTVNRFDLFKAQRFGDKEQNPYVKAGDTITISRSERIVTLSGEVRRPGTYQLLEDEGLKELVEIYGDGLLPVADRKRIRLDRVNTASDSPSEVLILDVSKSYPESFILKDSDQIAVPSRLEKLSVIFIEGAVNQTANNANNSTFNQNYTKRKTIAFGEGETLYSILKDNIALLAVNADLKNAYVVNVNAQVPVSIDLEKLLFAYRPSDDIELNPYDTLVIPYKQYFVLVNGGAQHPGQYPYLPDKTFQYYLDLAGGVNVDRGSSNKLQISDKDGKLRDSESFIQPEDTIYIPYSFGYYLLRYLPVTLSVISTTIAILNFLIP